MNKQGNWWLHALVHYDFNGEVLLAHRVTGEVSIDKATPKVCLFQFFCYHMCSRVWQLACSCQLMHE